jgi:Taurine catabolism dioxygenase TauD, TfdA family
VSQVCMTPITSPKAWRGETLARETSWIATLTDAQLADIDRALAAAKASGLPLEQIQREHFPLTVVRARLEQAVTEMYDGRGFVVLRGLPVRRYRDDDVGLIFWGFGRYMGAPLYQNPQGDLLGHVYDHGRTYGNIDVRGYETNAYLPYHTDAGDMVGLLCLRRSLEGGLSSIVSSTTVHNEILAQHPEYLGLLYNGYYYIRREAALTERGVSERPIPVFGYQDCVVSCRYIRNQNQRRRRQARGPADHLRARRAGLPR